MPFWAFGTIAVVSVASIYLLLGSSSDDDFVPTPATDQPWKVVAPFLVVVGLTGFTMELPLVVLGAWLESDFGMALVALAGVGFLLGSAELAGEGVMLAFTDRIGKRNSFAVGLAAASGAAVLLGFSGTSLILALASVFLVTFFLEFSFVSGIALASEYRPSNRSRFLAWFLVAAGVGRVAADLIGPMLFEAFGIRVVAWTAGGTAVLGATVLVARVREVDAEVAVRPPL
jgi:predicted MFS family arabinose efflux permease